MNTLFTLLALGLGNPPTPLLLHCPEPLVAKGEIKGGPPLTQTFDLTHRGLAGTLTITKVETGCGCVRRTLTTTVLKPGDSAKLTLEVNTLSQPDGPNRWQAIVSYTLELPAPEPSQKGEMVLAVTATLSREVTVNPAQIAFSSTGEAKQTLIVVDRRVKPLTVMKATSSSPYLTAYISEPVLGPNLRGQGQQIVIKLSADAPAGHRDEVLVLVTDDPTYPEFRVPIRVLKKAPGMVAAAPEEVAVRFGAGQDEVSSLVQLRAPEGKTIRIESAESDSADVTVKFSTTAGPVATVRITVGGKASLQAGAGRVKIRLAEPAGQEVIVPVTWTGGTKR